MIILIHFVLSCHVRIPFSKFESVLQYNGLSVVCSMHFYWNIERCFSNASQFLFCLDFCRLFFLRLLDLITIVFCSHHQLLSLCTRFFYSNENESEKNEKTFLCCENRWEKNRKKKIDMAK